jgi:hypothetical protein
MQRRLQLHSSSTAALQRLRSSSTGYLQSDRMPALLLLLMLTLMMLTVKERQQSTCVAQHGCVSSSRQQQQLVCSKADNTYSRCGDQCDCSRTAWRKMQQRH